MFSLCCDTSDLLQEYGESSVRGNVGTIVDIVSLGRDYNCNPDYYRTNSIINDNNDNNSISRTI